MNIGIYVPEQTLGQKIIHQDRIKTGKYRKAHLARLYKIFSCEFVASLVAYNGYNNDLPKVESKD